MRARYLRIQYPTTGALAAMGNEALTKVVNEAIDSALPMPENATPEQIREVNLSRKALAESAASLLGATTVALAGGSNQQIAQGGNVALNADRFNRQLHAEEKQRIKDLVKSTGLTEEKLTRAACYAVKCWAEFPEGSKEREAAYVGVAETFELGKELAVIQSTGANTGLFGYRTMDQTKDAFKATALPVIKNSAKTLGGGLAIATGSTICSTSGVGCVVGAPLALFGASEATEGATGLYRQYQGQGAAGFNPVRSGFNYVSPVWGDTIYDGTFLLLSAGSLGTTVPLKVGASDGINRANTMFGVTVPRWQNPVVNPLTNNIVLPQTAAQGVLLYGVGAKVPAVIEDVKKAKDSK